MKKIRLGLFISILMICSMVCTNIKALEYQKPSASRNLLNPDNLVLRNGRNALKQKIALDSGYYVFIFDYYFYGDIDSEEVFPIISIRKDGTQRVDDLGYDSQYYPTFVYSSFYFDDKYEAIYVEDFVANGMALYSHVKAGLYKVEQGEIASFLTNFSGIDNYVSDDYVCVNDAKIKYITNYDNPVSIEEIKKVFLATDKADGDITKNITLIKDKYTGSRNIGEYETVWQVTDNGGNKTKCTVTVLVVDTVPPVAEAVVSNVNVYLSDAHKGEAYQIYNQYIIASDNHVISSFDSESVKNYSINRFNPGSYEVTFNITDAAGNCTPVTLTINVKDDVAGDIYCKKIVVDQNSLNAMSDTELIKHLNQYLNRQGIKASNIKIVENNYLDNLNIEGVYDVYYTYEENGETTGDVFSLNVHKTVSSIEESNGNTVTFVVSAISILSTICLVYLFMKKQK